MKKIITEKNIQRLNGKLNKKEFPINPIPASQNIGVYAGAMKPMI